MLSNSRCLCCSSVLFKLNNLCGLRYETLVSGNDTHLQGRKRRKFFPLGIPPCIVIVTILILIQLLSNYFLFKNHLWSVSALYGNLNLIDYDCDFTFRWWIQFVTFIVLQIFMQHTCVKSLNIKWLEKLFYVIYRW